MMNLNEVLIRPLITEKNTMLTSLGRYTFEVDRRANKPLVKQAVEQIFKVNVTAVNVINVPPWKKAVVTLKSGQRLEVFEGV
jgi:large subunit ribosomal protein L23